MNSWNLLDMKCSSCGEQNDSGMQFCINCGNTLASAPPPPPPQPVMTEEQMMSMSHQNLQAVPMVLVCTVCNKSDPLNGVFCVFCGGKTVAGPAPRIQNYATGHTPMSTPAISPEYSHLSMEVPRVSTTQTHKKSQGSGVFTLVAIIVAMLLGAGAGFAGLIGVRDQVEQQALQKWWPADSLLVYSSVPNGKVRLEDIKHKNIILGSTSTDGTFVMTNLQAGAYTLNLSDGKGKELTHDFRINTGEPLILGYPERLKLRQ
jgi:hypothetical protein